MCEDITIRLAIPADSAMIADISRRTFYDSFSSCNTKEDMELFFATEFSVAKLEAENSQPGNIFLLAFLNGRLAGYAFLREGISPPALGNDPSMEIARIYAEQWAIGKKLGKALMFRCLEIAAGMHKSKVWLGVWEHNPRALAFYKQWGFKKFGEHIFWLGKDPQKDWLLYKSLRDIDAPISSIKIG